MQIGRRSFLGALAAGPALAAAPLAARQDAPRVAHSSFDPWLEIRPDHLRHNVAQVSARVDGRPVLAVIKNNGYGLGVAEVAEVLDGEPAIAALAVVKLSEAAAIRERSIGKPILLMGPFGEDDLEEIVSRDVMPMVYTPIGDALERAAARRGRPVAIHVCVDTGLGRVGVPYRSAAGLLRDLGARPGLRIEGVMTALSEDPELDAEQVRRLQAVSDDVRAAGVETGRLHAASSFALFQDESLFLDMVRPGMALFGVYSEAPFREAEILDLRPAVALRARVAYVKQLRAGDTAGYNRAYVADRDVWLATVPTGHADGWPRVTAQGARVRIGGSNYPIVASVSASHTLVELGPERAAEIGDVATLFDWEPGSRPEDVSAACGASVYDLLMHLGPLLPRRLV